MHDIHIISLLYTFFIHVLCPFMCNEYSLLSMCAVHSSQHRIYGSHILEVCSCEIIYHQNNIKYIYYIVGPRHQCLQLIGHSPWIACMRTHHHHLAPMGPLWVASPFLAHGIAGVKLPFAS